MSRLLLRWGAAIALLLLVLTGSAQGAMATALPTSPAQLVAIAPAADPSGSADEFGACLRSRQAAHVVLLVDESQSLEESDPAGQRVIAASHLVQEWKVLSDRGHVAINVESMGFSGDTSPGPWRSVATENAALVADVEAFAGRHVGQQTDYWMALNGARTALAQADPDAASCQAIVWFSDGKLDSFATFDVDGKQAVKPYLSSAGSNAEATSAAAVDLCRDGGLIDQLRSSSISLFAIGLNAGTSTAADFDLMKGLATGAPGSDGQPCGGISAAGKGWFKLATDISGLIAGFDELILPDAAVATSTAPICQGEVCAKFAHTFVLDNSLTWVHVLAHSDVHGLDLYVTPPGGTPVKVVDTFTVGAVQGSSKAYDEQTTNIDLIEPAGNWAGQWSIVFVDPKGSSTGLQSRTSISMAADLTPTVKVPTQVHAGESLEGLVLGLQRGAGDVIDPLSLKGRVVVQAALVDGADTRLPIVTDGDATAFGKPLRVDLTDVAVGAARIVVETQVTTAATTVQGAAVPGTELKPTAVEYALTVLPPLGFPTVATTAINFGLWDQDAPPSMSAPLHVVGPGCLWLTTTHPVSGPQRAGAVAMSGLPGAAAQATCLTQGEERDIPLTLRATASGNGGLTGEVLLAIAPTDDRANTREVKVAYSADLNRPPNTTVAWTAGILAFFLGVLIPLAIMYLLKWRSAKIKPFGGLLGGELPVVVTATGIDRPGLPGLLDPVELRDVLPIPSAGVRELMVGQVALRARTGWSPFSAARVEASLPGAVGLSSSDRSPHPSGAARMPLTLQHEWLLFHDPQGPADQAVIVLFAAGGTPRPDLQDRLTTLAGDVPELVERIRTAAGSGPTPDAPPTDPFAQAGVGAAMGGGADPFASQAGPFGSATFGGDYAGAGIGGGPPGTDPFAVGAMGGPSSGPPTAPMAQTDPSLMRTQPRGRPAEHAQPPRPPAAAPGSAANGPPTSAPTDADPFGIDWSTLSFDDRNPST